MRVPVLTALAVLAMSGSGFAQTSVYGTPPPPPGGYPMPPPGSYVPPVAPAGQALPPQQALTAPPATPIAPDGVPPGANPATGARPGNEIGTGMSLPLSNRSSNINPGDTRSPIAPRLPTPVAGDDASIRAYLANARDALAAGRTGEAQEALERAETRMLDRSVAPEDVRNPIRGPEVADVTAARRALASGDVPGAIQVINAALAR